MLFPSLCANRNFFGHLTHQRACLLTLNVYICTFILLMNFCNFSTSISRFMYIRKVNNYGVIWCILFAVGVLYRSVTVPT